MLALPASARSAGAPHEPPAARVVIAVLPYGTSVERIAAEPELAPGIVSAGLGSVAVAQTFLDIGQGNRVNEDLYDGDLPRLYLRDGQVPPRLWQRVVERADSAPAQIVPGLLASTVLDAGLPVRAEVDSGLSTLIVVDRDGNVDALAAVAVRSQLPGRPDDDAGAAAASSTA